MADPDLELRDVGEGVGLPGFFFFHSGEEIDPPGLPLDLPLRLGLNLLHATDTLYLS